VSESSTEWVKEVSCPEISMIIRIEVAPQQSSTCSGILGERSGYTGGYTAAKFCDSDSQVVERVKCEASPGRFSHHTNQRALQSSHPGSQIVKRVKFIKSGELGSHDDNRLAAKPVSGGCQTGFKQFCCIEILHKTYQLVARVCTKSSFTGKSPRRPPDHRAYKLST
jgi:hypothetical protein